MIGQSISHYKITGKLGEGGMGVVYKAEDTKLDRPVALKFLAPHLLRDEEGRRRFQREAKAAAKLDHPNICTVFEIDESEGRTYIVMALLEGHTLSDKIKEGPLKLSEALSIAIQMVEGLAAAHEKGITHRDIKPDNVMLMSGSRGLVKLMDFGLAQLSGGSKFTREGTTLGTVNYMSPEQANGTLTDHATDIWSLGIVLYEMVAGQRPFRGDFDKAILYSILNEAPEPLTAVRTGVPKELERIVGKCLAKSPEERYRHTDELLGDLQALRRELEPGSTRMEARPGPKKRTSPVLLAIGAIVLLAILGLGWWIGRSGGGSDESAPQYTLTQITRDTGFTGQPALSPDGRLLAYASDRAGKGNLDIWVQQLGGGDPIQLTAGNADESMPAFSPDGNRIAYLSRSEGFGLYVVPALGGDPRRIADVTPRTSLPRFSPDGASIVYSNLESSASNQVYIIPYIVPASGGAPRRLETNLASATRTLWSPDGTHLLILGGAQPWEFGRTPDFDWWLVPVEGGDAIALGVRDAVKASGLRQPIPQEWMSEGNWIVFSSGADSETQNIWRIRISASERRLVGNPQKLTAGTGEENPSVSRDGRIAFMTGETDWDIWALPLDANRAEVWGDLERVVSGLGADQIPSISSDGRKLVYTSNRSGNPDVWLRDLDSGRDTAITVNPAPDWRGLISPDGTKVVFSRRGSVGTDVYLTELGRGGERLILQDVGFATDWTPDGRRVLYYTNSPIRWKTIDVTTGADQDLGLEHEKFPVHSVSLAPNQDWAAFKLQTENPTLFLSPLAEGRAKTAENWLSLGGTGSMASGRSWWSPDGNTLYVLSDRDEFQCIWAQPLDPVTKQPHGPRKAVMHFHERARILGAAWFGNAMTVGKLYLPIAEPKGNIWLAAPRMAN